MGVFSEFDIITTNYWLQIVVACILLILSVLEKRKRWQNVCCGRPSLVIPFRSLDGYENRIAYAMAFGTTTNTVVSLITSTQTVVFDSPLAIKAFDVYIQAMIGCLTCYPLFACVTTRYKALGAILCIAYSLCWLSLNVIQVIRDIQENTNTTILGVQIVYQLSDTTAMNVTYAYQIMQGLPSICCYMVLIGYSVYILHRCYSSRTYFSKGLESSVQPHQEEHVRWVLRKYQLKNSLMSGSLGNEFVKSASSQTFVDQMKASFKLRYFTSFCFFKYPTRIVTLAFVQLNVLYWIGLLLVMCTTTVLYLMINAEFTKQFLNQYDLDIIIIASGSIFSGVYVFLVIWKVPNFLTGSLLCVCSSFALVVCILNAMVQIFIAFRNYRFDILRIYQGNRTFVPMLKASSQHILARSMTFPGFQVAFMMWGIVVCFAAVLLLTLIPVLILYILAKLSLLADVALQVLQLLSFPTSVFIMFYLQAFMAKKVLLQGKMKTTDKCPPLNVDNRKFYELFNYYSLFSNLAVGIFTCLGRIAESAMIGIFSVGRLDRSVFTRENEKIDKGYTAYTSMLLVDNAHNNPCMRVFAHLLWTKTLAHRHKQFQSQEEMNEHTGLLTENTPRYKCTETITRVPKSPCSPDTEGSPWTFFEINGNARVRKACIRWHLAYTLMNNPQLCKHRKSRLNNGSCELSFVVTDSK